METKLIEIRDRATFIPALAVRVSRFDGPLARRAGYGDALVILTRLDGGGKASHDPYEWNDRTMSQAHHALAGNWDAYPNNAVVDVEYLLGETTTPKESECAE